MFRNYRIVHALPLRRNRPEKVVWVDDPFRHQEAVEAPPRVLDQIHHHSHHHRPAAAAVAVVVVVRLLAAAVVVVRLSKLHIF